MIDFTSIGPSLPRSHWQRGQLSDREPKRGKLPRGRYWARWRVYLSAGGQARKWKWREKIIDRDTAMQLGLELSYEGPLTKSDAWRVLEKLIRETNSPSASGTNPLITFGELAREYMAMAKPGWSANTARVNQSIIETHLIGKFGTRPVRSLTDVELQEFLNGYVERNYSTSILGKLVKSLRYIMKRAVKKQVIPTNPAEDLKARSTKKPSELWHEAETCAALCAELSGRNHLAVRLFIQLGLRSEELFALRRNDVRSSGAQLVIDEAFTAGALKEVKTEASAAVMFVPPGLAFELENYLETIPPDPETWLFSTRKGVPQRPNNFLARVLKPAAVRAGIALRKNKRGETTTALNFQSLRRTSSTLFGSLAKDPKLTQAHLRHADPGVSLKHYQKAIPAEVKAAAMALESDLLEHERRRRAGKREARLA